MHELLVEAMGAYFRAGSALDVDALDACYDDGFENVRVDRAGRTVVLGKAQFMARFRELRSRGGPSPHPRTARPACRSAPSTATRRRSSCTG